MSAASAAASPQLDPEHVIAAEYAARVKDNLSIDATTMPHNNPAFYKALNDLVQKGVDAHAAEADVTATVAIFKTQTKVISDLAWSLATGHLVSLATPVATPPVENPVPGILQDLTTLRQVVCLMVYYGYAFPLPKLVPSDVTVHINDNDKVLTGITASKNSIELMSALKAAVAVQLPQGTGETPPVLKLAKESWEDKFKDVFKKKDPAPASDPSATPAPAAPPQDEAVNDLVTKLTRPLPDCFFTFNDAMLKVVASLTDPVKVQQLVAGMSNTRGSGGVTFTVLHTVNADIREAPAARNSVPGRSALQPQVPAQGDPKDTPPSANAQAAAQAQAAKAKAAEEKEAGVPLPPSDQVGPKVPPQANPAQAAAKAQAQAQAAAQAQAQAAAKALATANAALETADGTAPVHLSEAEAKIFDAKREALEDAHTAKMHAIEAARCKKPICTPVEAAQHHKAEADAMKVLHEDEAALRAKYTKENATNAELAASLASAAYLLASQQRAAAALLVAQAREVATAQATDDAKLKGAPLTAAQKAAAAKLLKEQIAAAQLLDEQLKETLKHLQEPEKLSYHIQAKTEAAKELLRQHEEAAELLKSQQLHTPHEGDAAAQAKLLASQQSAAAETLLHAKEAARKKRAEVPVTSTPGEFRSAEADKETAAALAATYKEEAEALLTMSEAQSAAIKELKVQKDKAYTRVKELAARDHDDLSAINKAAGIHWYTPKKSEATKMAAYKKDPKYSDQVIQQAQTKLQTLKTNHDLLVKEYLELTGTDVEEEQVAQQKEFLGSQKLAYEAAVAAIKTRIADDSDVPNEAKASFEQFLLTIPLSSSVSGGALSSSKKSRGQRSHPTTYRKR